MKNIKLLIVTFIFSGLLIGCGMKGPLYRTPTTKAAEPVTEDTKEALAEAILKPQATIETVNNIQDQQPPTVSESDISIANKQTPESKMKDAISVKNELLTPNAQLLAISASHLTLQLAAMDSKESLQQFAVKHNLPQKDVYIYQTTHNSKPRYIVIFGEYKNKQLAEEAAKNLPGSFANMDYWIREYQRVHQELLLNNE